MSNFISQNIVSEGGLTATTANINIISGSTLSATTIYGDGSNITNVTATASPAGVNGSIQYNSAGVTDGSSSLLYSGGTLFFTGTSKFNGSFFKTNSPSVKQVHQWGGTITAGAAPGIVWTNMPAALAVWLNSSATLTNDSTFITDLTEYTECRLFTSLQVAGAAATTLIKVQYSPTIGGTYLDMVSVTIGNTTGAKDSGWVSIPVEARGLEYIRLVGQNGNGTIDPRFSPPILLIR
jgi:hypothetical protein